MYANIILPLALRQTYTYAIPAALLSQVKVGVRVEVAFGKNRHYSGIVESLQEQAPAFEAKPILEVLDQAPIVPLHAIEHWRWMAEYYCCTVGEVMAAAIPAGLKLSSETRLALSPLFDSFDESLDKKERLITDALLVQTTISIEDVQKILNIKSVMPLVKSLLEKRFVYLYEETRDTFKPRTASFVRFAEPYRSDLSQLKNAFELLKGERQVETLLALSQLLRGVPDIPSKKVYEAAKSNITVLKSLADKGIVEVFNKEISRLRVYETDDKASFELSNEQNWALEKIEEDFRKKNVVLLQGVTGSGKTQVYIRLIQSVLAQGKQVLYLVPEIALTAQLTNRLQKHFGEQLALYHSKFNDNERVELWKAVAAGRQVVIGARSAMFLPFQNLGLIIVDEEHDASYKQTEPAPRYHARDASIFLAHLHKAKVLLGTATPCLETHFNVISQKYGFAELTERFGGLKLPAIEIVDLRDAYKRKQMKQEFSPTLLTGIAESLGRKEQVILFQNRRGYAPVMRCRICAWTSGCQHCDVSLTYHKATHDLRCHYCGYTANLPRTCPACGSHDLKVQGYGTEKIEDDLKIHFPDARIERMDLDTVKGKHDHDKLIEKFEDKEIDILVGTQMVTKGLDFENVALVGVISADQLISYPDFRSTERAYQLLTQVSGRAGRKHAQGKVIIQAYNVEHTVLGEVMNNDYNAFTQRELREREVFLYPPYYRLINIQIKHKVKNTADAAAEFFSKELRKTLLHRVLGPSEPPVNRVRDYYILNLMVKLERNTELINTAKKAIDTCTVALLSQKGYSSVRVVVDVDVY